MNSRSYEKGYSPPERQPVSLIATQAINGRINRNRLPCSRPHTTIARMAAHRRSDRRREGKNPLCSDEDKSQKGALSYPAIIRPCAIVDDETKRKDHVLTLGVEEEF